MLTGMPQSILVVEDEVLIRLMISDDLMQAGFQVIQATTADDALKALQSPDQSRSHRDGHSHAR